MKKLCINKITVLKAFVKYVMKIKVRAIHPLSQKWPLIEVVFQNNSLLIKQLF